MCKHLFKSWLMWVKVIFTTIRKMRNACAGSVGRYIKWLMHCAMYTKNLYFLFKLMIFKKNGELEKIKFLCLSLLKKQVPQRISLVVQPQTFISFKKNSSLQFKKFEEGEDQKQWSIVLNPESFCTYFTAYWSRTEGQPPCFGV